MQLPSSSHIPVLTLSLPSPTSMETDNLFPCESFSYSLRLSFDAESFIEFDPKLLSMRWSIKAQEGEAPVSSLDLDSLLPSLSLDSAKSLLSRSNRYAVPGVPVSSSDAARSTERSRVSKKHGFGLSLKKYLWFVLLKFCRRIREQKPSKMRIVGKSSVKVASAEPSRGKRVFDVDTASSIQDAVLHCKNSNLSSLMEGECKLPVAV